MKVRCIEIAEVFLGTKLIDSDFKNDGIMKDVAIFNYENILTEQESLILEDTIKNTFKEDKKKTIKKVKLSKKIKAGLVKKQDIVLPIKKKNHIPQFINWQTEEEMSFLYNADLLIVRADTDIVLPKFLYYLLKNDNVVSYINKIALEKHPNRISCELINKLVFEIPNIEEQKKLIEKLEKINKEKLEIQNELNEYTKNII